MRRRAPSGSLVRTVGDLKEGGVQMEDSDRLVGLTLEELEAEKSELLPDRVEMQAVFQNSQQFQAFNINPNQIALNLGVALP
jgi:hypothetical protein